MALVRLAGGIWRRCYRIGMVDTRPKRIYASTRNQLYRSAVNAFGTYCIRYGQMSYDERIENMSIIDADNLQHMQEMYIESSLIALCLPEKALSSED